MIRISKDQKIGGLCIAMKLGDIIQINNEISIQLWEVSGRQRARVVIKADKEKYVISRLVSGPRVKNDGGIDQ